MATNSNKNKRGSISLSLDWDKIFKKRQIRAAVVGSDINFSQTTVHFCTGSSYNGKWNILGMASRGTYTYPYNCEYNGGFEDGMFHGRGVLSYPMGQKLACIWHRGKMLSYSFVHSDGMEGGKDYCKMPDRRFMLEIREGLQPAGRENLTNQSSPRYVPEDCCDTGDGFYNRNNNCILSARVFDDVQDDNQKAETKTSVKGSSDKVFWVNTITAVSKERGKFILEHFRKGWNEPAGYRPEFYEDWISGRLEELEQLEDSYKIKETSDKDVKEVEVQPKPASNSAVITPVTTYAGTGRKLLPGSKMELFFNDSANIFEINSDDVLSQH